MESRANYKVYNVTATTDEQTLILVDDSSVVRSSGYIQIRNTAGQTASLILTTQENKVADFDSDNKTISLANGSSFDDSLEVLSIKYKTAAGTATLEVYVSW